MNSAEFSDWTDLKDEMPEIGQLFLFWHPIYELERGYFEREGFFTAQNGKLTEFTNITYCPLELISLNTALSKSGI